MTAASRSNDTADFGGSLPAFVERAREDAHARAALARIGYARVKAVYTRHQRIADGSDRLRGFERENLAPRLDLVRDWLSAERKRIVLRVRWTFLGAMLATIVLTLALAAAFALS
jgi:hypothetical protein